DRGIHIDLKSMLIGSAQRVKLILRRRRRWLSGGELDMDERKPANGAVGATETSPGSDQALGVTDLRTGSAYRLPIEDETIRALGLERQPGGREPRSRPAAALGGGVPDRNPSDEPPHLPAGRARRVPSRGARPSRSGGEPAPGPSPDRPGPRPGGRRLPGQPG